MLTYQFNIKDLSTIVQLLHLVLSRTEKHYLSTRGQNCKENEPTLFSTWYAHEQISLLVRKESVLSK